MTKMACAKIGRCDGEQLERSCHYIDICNLVLFLLTFFSGLPSSKLSCLELVDHMLKEVILGVKQELQHRDKPPIRSSCVSPHNYINFYQFTTKMDRCGNVRRHDTEKSPLY